VWQGRSPSSEMHPRLAFGFVSPHDTLPRQPAAYLKKCRPSFPSRPVKSVFEDSLQIVLRNPIQVGLGDTPEVPVPVGPVCLGCSNAGSLGRPGTALPAAFLAQYPRGGLGILADCTPLRAPHLKYRIAPPLPCGSGPDLIVELSAIISAEHVRRRLRVPRSRLGPVAAI
jgi:hypothetical protein